MTFSVMPTNFTTTGLSCSQSRTRPSIHSNRSDRQLLSALCRVKGHLLTSSRRCSYLNSSKLFSPCTPDTPRRDDTDFEPSPGTCPLPENHRNTEFNINNYMEEKL